MTEAVLASPTNPTISTSSRRRTAPPLPHRGMGWDELCYRLWGPAGRSMQLEGYHWLVLMILVVSNMQGVYRESYGTRRDFVFLFWTGLWLGKHLWLRWIACWDPSTVHSPTLRGLISHFTTNHLMGGQIYDRPSPRQISKFLGLKDDSVPLLQKARSSFDYAAKLSSRGVGTHLRCILAWFQQRRGGSPEGDAATPSSSVPKPLISKPRSKFGCLMADVQRWWQIVRQNIPSVQFSLYCLGLYAVKSLIRQRLLGFYGQETASTYLYSPSLGVAMKQENNMIKRKGDYQPRDFAESWWGDVYSTPVLVFMALTMWIFARLVPPLPDLVAGSHPLRDLRNDKTESGNTTTSSSNSASSGSGFFSRLQEMLGFVSPTEHGWSEAQNPISTVPRIDVHTAVVFLRMVDIFWVVLWLPRCDTVCQLTGHCVSAWDWDERTYYLYPVGLTGPERSARPYHFFPNQVGDSISLLFISFDLWTIVPMLLFVQSLLANRTYWSTWGVCAGEWMILEFPDSVNKNVFPAWDVRKKYNKDDIVLHNNKVFKATVSQPEGRPYEGFQRHMQNLLANETGDPATSGILYRIAGLQLVIFFVHFLAWYYFHLNWIRCDGLFMSLVAHALTTYVLSTAGRVRPSSSLAKLNAEVMGK
uniref:Uncharacterized protein n=1 Tax=Amphora coffeiformis TaxID=265554 RepID=A0A7S3LCX6_9STRA